MPDDRVKATWTQPSQQELREWGDSLDGRK